MRMTQSQVRFRNEVNYLAYQAVIGLQQKKIKNKKKQFDFGILSKAKIPLIIVAIAIAGYKMIPFSTSSTNAVYQEDSLSSLGKELASVSTFKISSRRVTVMFLFNKSNRRYSPLAEALLAELNEKNLIVKVEWPLDGESVDEDEFGQRVDEAIANNLSTDILMIISAGGVDYIEQSNAFADFVESEKQLIVLGNCAINSAFINLAEERKCVMVSRKKGWLKEKVENGINIQKFFLDDYVVIGKI